MVAKTSTMLPLGTLCPDFALPEPLTGKTISLKDFSDNPFLLGRFHLQPLSLCQAYHQAFLAH